MSCLCYAWLTHGNYEPTSWKVKIASWKGAIDMKIGQSWEISLHLPPLYKSFLIVSFQTMKDWSLFLNMDAFRRIKAPEINGAGKAFWVRVPSCICWSWLLSHSAGVGRDVWEKVACRYFSLKTVEVFISNPIKVPQRALEKSREGVVTAERLCPKMKRVCGNTLENNKLNWTPRLSLGQCPNKYGDKLILQAESK